MNPLQLFKANPVFMMLLGAVILALGIYVGALHLQLGLARGDASKWKGEYSRVVGITHQWKATYQSLQIKTAECNASVNDLSAASERAKRKSDAELARVRAESAQRKRVIDAIDAREREKMTCGDAVKAARGDL